ncbi:MAG: hypothetical protein PHS62_05365 [Patescibacteria group bacterium]|nr:hypothetical protein [Patescibacteria group bacterium]
MVPWKGGSYETHAGEAGSRIYLYHIGGGNCCVSTAFAPITIPLGASRSEQKIWGKAWAADDHTCRFFYPLIKPGVFSWLFIDIKIG